MNQYTKKLQRFFNLVFDNVEMLFPLFIAWGLFIWVIIEFIHESQAYQKGELIVNSILMIVLCVAIYVLTKTIAKEYIRQRQIQRNIRLANHIYESLFTERENGGDSQENDDVEYHVSQYVEGFIPITDNTLPRIENELGEQIKREVDRLKSFKQQCEQTIIRLENQIQSTYDGIEKTINPNNFLHKFEEIIGKLRFLTQYKLYVSVEVDFDHNGRELYIKIRFLVDPLIITINIYIQNITYTISKESYDVLDEDTTDEYDNPIIYQTSFSTIEALVTHFFTYERFLSGNIML